MHKRIDIEWPTLGLILFTYGGWGLVLFWGLPTWITVPILALFITQQSSLQHEGIHGHPTPWRWVNQGLVMPSLNLMIPFLRFRDTHLAHHHNSRLTDPYDDPESNYLTFSDWKTLRRAARSVMQVNNTLLGRMILGPTIGQIYFMKADWRQMRSGDQRVVLAWVVHLATSVLLLAMIWVSPTGFIPYFIAAYSALAILKIRTFAEHQAHEKIGPRSIVIEDRGPLSLLFLNNNYHLVHHMHPKVPWYALPALYRRRRARFLMRNDHYVFFSYFGLFRKYLLCPKDPVVHPNWHEGA